MKGFTTPLFYGTFTIFSIIIMFNFSKNKSRPSRYLPEEIPSDIALFEKYTNKIIKPTKSEIEKNNPSRSAKLRYVIKKKDFFDFETDVLKKFNNLIEIENIKNKIWKNY